jgi:hypothetical protein
VAAQKTATEPVRFREALARAHQDITGKEAPEPLLDVLTAHVSHETASGTKMYNFNFGGIKGASPDGLTAHYKTTEVLHGKSRKLVDGFRAYRKLDDGARDYLLFLQQRYGQAYAHAEHGDVAGFSRALKDKGYYTASPQSYAKGLARHLGDTTTRDPSLYTNPTEVNVRYVTARADQAGDGGRFLFGRELAMEGVDEHLSTLPTREVLRVLNDMTALTARIVLPTEEEPTEGWHDSSSVPARRSTS